MLIAGDPWWVGDHVIRFDSGRAVEHRVQAATDAAVRSIADTDDAIYSGGRGPQREYTNAHLLINSSFLYRDKSIKTAQSSRQLLALVVAGYAPHSPCTVEDQESKFIIRPLCSPSFPER